MHGNGVNVIIHRQLYDSLLITNTTVNNSSTLNLSCNYNHAEVFVLHLFSTCVWKFSPITTDIVGNGMICQTFVKTNECVFGNMITILTASLILSQYFLSDKQVQTRNTRSAIISLCVRWMWQLADPSVRYCLWYMATWTHCHHNFTDNGLQMFDDTLYGNVPFLSCCKISVFAVDETWTIWNSWRLMQITIKIPYSRIFVFYI